VHPSRAESPGNCSRCTPSTGVTSHEREDAISRSIIRFRPVVVLGASLRSIPPCVWNRVREGYWIRTFFVALGVYIGAGLVEAVADALAFGNSDIGILITHCPQFGYWSNDDCCWWIRRRQAAAGR